jgi:hypothetical protein
LEKIPPRVCGLKTVKRDLAKRLDTRYHKAFRKNRLGFILADPNGLKPARDQATFKNTIFFKNTRPIPNLREWSALIFARIAIYLAKISMYISFNR